MGYSSLLNKNTKRWLRRNKATSHPSNLLFVDTETLAKSTNTITGAENHSLRLGHAIAERYEHGKTTRRSTIDFTSSGEFWSFLSSRTHPRLPLWVFAHNLPFDLSILEFWQRLDNRLFGFTKDEINFTPDALKSGDRRKFKGLFIDSDPPTVISVHDVHGCKVTFVDTLNYWRLSLSTLGESLGFPKLDSPEFSAPDSDWQVYCRRDVEILERAITGLMDWHIKHDLGAWGLTQAQMSMSAFRHRFYTKPIELHENSEVKKLERESYFGGRLELHFRGRVDGPIYGLDVNSMYPALMQTRDFPRELIVSSADRRNADLAPDQLSIAHIAEVLLTTESDTFPLRTKAGTTYPIGRYWTTLAGPELVRARESRVIERVGRWAEYSCYNLFSDYVTFFYTLRQAARQAGNEVESLFCKIFMNSLYGKFGQKTPDWQDVDESLIHSVASIVGRSEDLPDKIRDFEDGVVEKLWEILDAETGLSPTLRKVGNHWQLKIARKEHPQAFPAIASFVTAYGRELIYTLRTIAGENNVYYVVTDALFVNQTGYDCLNKAGWIDNSKLGKLSVVCQGNWAEFTALHHYIVGDKKKFGSRKKSAIELEPGKIRELHFEGLRSLIKRPGDGTVKIYPVEKTFSRSYTRGEIQTDGRIKPLWIDNVD